MKTSELEELVRSKLIEQRTEMLVKFVSKDNAYKQKIIDTTDEYSCILFDILTESKLEELDKAEKKDAKKELKEAKAEFRKENLKKVKKSFSPEHLAESMYAIAKQDYSSFNEVKAKLEGMYASLEENGIEPGVIKQYRNAAKPVLETVKQKDLFIKELTKKIAKDEDLDRILEISTQHEIIRKMFPTAGIYRKYQVYALKQANDYLKDMSKIESANKTEDVPNLAANYNFLKKMMKIDEKMHLDYLNKQIKEIYGTK